MNRARSGPSSQDCRCTCGCAVESLQLRRGDAHLAAALLGEFGVCCFLNGSRWCPRFNNVGPHNDVDEWVIEVGCVTHVRAACPGSGISAPVLAGFTIVSWEGQFNVPTSKFYSAVCRRLFVVTTTVGIVQLRRRNDQYLSLLAPNVWCGLGVFFFSPLSM